MTKHSEATRANRLHIGIFGRCNAGKSTLCNALSGQNVALVSPEPGTTTDPVEKVMEMAPLGPVVLHDTAGLDDTGSLGEARVKKSLEQLHSVDLALLVLGDTLWGEPEEQAVAAFAKARIPFGIVCNCRSEEARARAASLAIGDVTPERIVVVSREDDGDSLAGLEAVKKLVASLAPRDAEPPMLADLLPTPAARLVLVCPQDSGAPRGRLIMPQVQAIRDALDARALCLVCTEKQYPDALASFGNNVHLVVCDSQVVHTVAKNTPPDILLTTFSILMARLKGDLELLVRGAWALTTVQPNDTVLIQEACSHHAQKDDIGRVKIPKLLAKLAGGPVHCPMLAGRHWADYEGSPKAIVHCGGCALTRREMNARLEEAHAKNIPMTNYGMAISLAQGLLHRTLAPFPKALSLWQRLSGQKG